MINEMRLNELMPMPRAPAAVEAGHRWDDTFGIELELENVRQREDGTIGDFDYWRHHRDGSLLGGMELVLNPPRNGPRLVSAINEFYAFTGEYTGGLRTSTHVHINASDLTVGQLRSVILFTYAIENPLFRVVGESRKWCGYAMGLSEMAPRRFRNIMRTTSNQTFSSAIHAPRGGERYYGLNVASIQKHGSLEFRHFPGAPTREELESWLDLVKGLKRLGQAIPVPNILDALETEEQLMQALRRYIPAPILDRLLDAAIPNEIWTAFNEALALIGIDEVPDRLDQLITIPRPLILYMVKSKTLTPAQAERLAEYGKQMRMMTIRDFRNIFNAVKAETTNKPRKTGARNFSDIAAAPLPRSPHYQNVFNAAALAPGQEMYNELIERHRRELAARARGR